MFLFCRWTNLEMSSLPMKIKLLIGEDMLLDVFSVLYLGKQTLGYLNMYIFSIQKYLAITWI